MRFRKITGAACAATALVVSGVVSTASPASAAVVACGTTITQTTTLTANVGPCGDDGIIIGADNITLNLNGFKITGVNRSPGDHAGVRIPNRTGVTVRGKGTIQRFDAGVAIFGGSGNTVSGVSLLDNRNDGKAPPCDLGDGISMLDSDNNTIQSNKVVRSGPYGGITTIGDSDGNMIKGNTVVGSNLQGISGSGCGNANQDEGIRLEGPGANNNTVLNNAVSNSLLAGIGVHGNVGCRNNPPGPNDTPNNDFNIIRGNTVSGTASILGDGESDGIKILDQGPFGTVVCAAANTTIEGNNSSNNERHGIQIPGTSINNTVNYNTVNSNGVDGIRLGSPIFRNTFTNIGPTVLDLITPDQPTFMMGTDFTALNGSGSGDVTAPLVAVGAIDVTPPIGFDSATSGCEPADFAGFPVGGIALIQRGLCARQTKIDNAVAAGASAVILFNEGSPGREGLVVAGVGPTSIPVVDATFATGQALYNLTQQGPVTIRVATNTTNVQTQVNVGAENNTLMKNIGYENGEHDGHDENQACDQNLWVGNLFGTVNKECVKANGGTGNVSNPAP